MRNPSTPHEQDIQLGSREGIRFVGIEIQDLNGVCSQGWCSYSIRIVIFTSKSELSSMVQKKKSNWTNVLKHQKLIQIVCPIKVHSILNHETNWHHPGRATDFLKLLGQVFCHFWDRIMVYFMILSCLYRNVRNDIECEYHVVNQTNQQSLFMLVYCATILYISCFFGKCHLFCQVAALEALGAPGAMAVTSLVPFSPNRGPKQTAKGGKVSKDFGCKLWLKFWNCQFHRGTGDGLLRANSCGNRQVWWSFQRPSLWMQTGLPQRCKEKRCVLGVF